MGRPKSEDPKTVISIRVNSRQLQTLKRYVEIKGLSSEGDGIRRMIDGAEAWVNSQGTAQPAVSGPVTSHQEAPVEHHIEEAEDENSGPLGYIGGRLNVGLPKAGYTDDGEFPPGDAE